MSHLLSDKQVVIRSKWGVNFVSVLLNEYKPTPRHHTRYDVLSVRYREGQIQLWEIIINQKLSDLINTTRRGYTTDRVAIGRVAALVTEGLVVDKFINDLLKTPEFKKSLKRRIKYLQNESIYGDEKRMMLAFSDRQSHRLYDDPTAMAKYYKTKYKNTQRRIECYKKLLSLIEGR